jgi:predicted NAD/FAD-binding protein
MTGKPRLAIIGSGISGLAAGFFLQHDFDLTLFETEGRIGGHTNTRMIDVSRLRAGVPAAQALVGTAARGPHREGGTSGSGTSGSATAAAGAAELLGVDTGFIVFNDRTYPNFIRLLDLLGVSAQATEMSFSVRCDASGIEYCGTNLNTYFAQRRNCLRPSFYRFLYDFRRFAKQALRVLDSQEESQTVAEFFRAHRYSDAFYRRYFLPMGSAIWSCPSGVFQQFPIRFICQFYHHHGLLTIKHRPQWRVIVGGSHHYLSPLTAGFESRVVTGAEVAAVVRNPDSREGVASRWRVAGRHRLADGSTRPWEGFFEHVVFACHADQALQILGPVAAGRMAETLSAFPYQRNLATLHTDRSVLPQNRRAWAAWNYHLPRFGGRQPLSRPATDERDQQDVATVTYNMNRLQRFGSEQTGGRVFCVTLNDDARIDPNQIIEQIPYAHPVFSTRRLAAQANHDRLIDAEGLSFCGAYWGNGFHEDGLNSALAVSRKLLGTDPWKVASTLVGSSTDGSPRSLIGSETDCSSSVSI